MKRLKKFHFHIPTIISIICFLVISIITIYSAMMYLPSYLGNLALKQLLWYIIGFIFIIIIILLTNKPIYEYAWYIYITCCLFLFVLLIIGQPINGSKCWFIIPGIGSIQPSEFMKIALIIVLSIITNKWIKEKNPTTLKKEIIFILKVGIIILIPAVLTFLEPDTGAIFIYFIIGLAILWTSPLRKRWFIIAFILIIIVLGGVLSLYYFKQDMFVDIFGTDLFYRIDRILDWKQGTGMQLENSLTAIGSSGLMGHGHLKTPIYFPEAGTDFIFAVYASNFGLIGSLILLGIILYFDLNLMKLAKNISSYTDKFILSGILGMLLYQQVQNIGMTLGILPITGITLPFISYGGSSLVSYLIMVGIILNIYETNKKTIN